MKVEIIRCDRCGRQLTGWTSMSYTSNIPDLEIKEPVNIELCLECTKDFIKFMDTYMPPMVRIRS